MSSTNTDPDAFLQYRMDSMRPSWWRHPIRRFRFNDEAVKNYLKQGFAL